MSGPRIRPPGRRRDERGSSAVELLGVVPVLVVVVLVLLQVVAAVYTTQATNQAARDGARALSMGQSAEVAIDRSLPSGLSPQSISYVHGGQGVRLEVRVPRWSVFPVLTVDRTAVMPRLVP
ncbi:TadE/TadG family type IV pilus assembly protein [Actinotalea sp. K2]|uniref:TadE/TadG family type IV pilus assembly protein n=1 Tax=Actinotalea sp. K2 TaxID=2939438 RepID=UPI002016F029|nr:TadE/TadG family type IV pilus assembly protein [Actinotalea sp. K2]MCL3859940.1 pilus assembly protein [Actinotalea sp. K2]